jgi:energy-coupling factor transporter ATP-binding protein EcfA2
LNLLIKENISGKTIITSTHDLNIVDKISDTIYVLSQDKTIIKCGKPQEILNNERLLQNNNLLYIYNHLK